MPVSQRPGRVVPPARTKQSNIVAGTYNYLLTPWVWRNINNKAAQKALGIGMGWHAPVGAVGGGGLDLRPLPAQSLKGGAPNGFMFAVMDRAASVPRGSINLGSDLLGRLNLARRRDMAAALNLDADDIDSETLLDALFDVWHGLADITGDNRNKPGVGAGNTLGLLIPGHNISEEGTPQIAVAEPIDHGRHRFIAELYQQGYEKLRGNTDFNNAAQFDHLLKVAGGFQKKYGFDIRTTAQKEDGPTRPPTTIIHDDFVRAAADALGSSSEGWAWTEVDGDFDIISSGVAGGAIGSAGTDIASTARAETDLSTVDMHAVVKETVANSTSSFACGAVRYDPASDTCYIGISRVLGALTNVAKIITGTYTELGTSTGGLGAGNWCDIEANGDFITNRAQGIGNVQVNDTAIDGVTVGGLRTGVATAAATADFSHFTSFYAGDVEDILIDIQTAANSRKRNGDRTVVSISPLVTYVAYQGSDSRASWIKTTDGGLTWPFVAGTDGVDLSGSFTEFVNAWWDGWHPGNGGNVNIIHYAMISITAGGPILIYRALDTSDDTFVAAAKTVHTAILEATADSDRNERACSIIRAQNGDLHIVAKFNNTANAGASGHTESVHYVSSDEGVNWTNADTTYTLYANDTEREVILCPWNTGDDTADITAMVIIGDAVDDIELWQWDASIATPAWAQIASSTSVTSGFDYAPTGNPACVLWDHLTNTFYWFWTTGPGAGGSILMYKFENSHQATTHATGPITVVAAGDAALFQICAAGIDINTKILTVAYPGDPDGIHGIGNMGIIYKATSSNGGTTWSAPVQAGSRWGGLNYNVCLPNMIMRTGGQMMAVYEDSKMQEIWAAVTSASVTPPATTSIFQHHRIGVPLGVGL